MKLQEPNRQKILIAVFLAAAVFSIYFQTVYKPLSKKIAKYKSRIEKTRLKLEDPALKFPKPEQYKKDIQSLDFECNDLSGRINAIEKSIPGKESASQLLRELTRCAQGLKMISIKQKAEATGEYPKIYVELKFNAPYKNIINYIRRLESISSFLVVEELDISKPKSIKEEGSVFTSLMLSSILKEDSAAEIAVPAQKEDIEIARDVFTSRLKPVSYLKEPEFKLEGITYDLQNPTAIVSGEVKKVGSRVANFTIKEIRPDAVILTNGMEDCVLSIKRGA